MFKIKNVLIEGFWGKYTIKTDLNEDVNIFIGRNGTGKTTFINLLQAVISVDLELLYNLQFENIIISLKDGKKSRKIVVHKIEQNLQYKELQYQIGSSKFNIPIIPDRELKYLNNRNGRIHPRFFKQIQEIKAVLNTLVNVSYLSVNRHKVLNEEYQDSKRDDVYNAIDLRLETLISELTSYQLQIETDLGKLSKRFQEDVLRSMLFNEKFDYIDLNEPFNWDLRRTSVELKQAYRGLGILDESTSDAIDSHVEAIKKSASTINNFQSTTNTPIYPNDITPLTLLRRTNRINELSNELEKNKKSIFERLNDYINLLNEFHETKKFTLHDSKIGGFSVAKNDNEIQIKHLSSGEKQLIILLTEVLLQKGTQTLFIADEPELSLHIEWQRKVISSIRKLNPNSQIIVATHSPEIVGKFKDSTINMERIING